VGPGGNFMGHEHTFKYFREEIWSPRFLIRDRWEQWEAKGKTTPLEGAVEAVREILKNHSAAPLSDGALEEMERIIVECESKS